jgi:hypothetical protein
MRTVPTGYIPLGLDKFITGNKRGNAMDIARIKKSTDIPTTSTVFISSYGPENLLTMSMTSNTNDKKYPGSICRRYLSRIKLSKHNKTDINGNISMNFPCLIMTRFITEATFAIITNTSKIRIKQLLNNVYKEC